MTGAANLRKQLENIRAHGVEPVVAINAMPERLPLRARRDPRARRVHGHQVRGRHALRRRRPRRRRDRRGGRRGGRASRTASTTCTRPRRTLKEKIETLATKVYGADGVDYTPLASRQLDGLREERLRRPAGLRRQDPVQPEPRRQPQGRPDRLPPPGPRGPRQRRRRLHLPDLRRHAHHAGPGQQPRRRQHRPRRERQHRRPLLITRQAEGWGGSGAIRPPWPSRPIQNGGGLPSQLQLARDHSLLTAPTCLWTWPAGE